MRTTDAVRAGGDAFDCAADALRMAGAALDYLNSPAVAGLDGNACGELLIGLGELQAKLTAAHAAFLRRFDAANAHDTDGYGSSSSWLSAKAGMSKGAARASVRRMRQLGDRPLLGMALADGDITDSLAFTIADWTRKLPAGMRTETDRILLEAAAAGASVDDLATIAACAIERWRQQQPDPDNPDDAFDDRYVQVGTTFGGAGVIHGNLTPECAAAVRAVLEALGKKAGPEDDRTDQKRFHDALQLACELLLRARLVPDRAGADTQVVAHIPLSQLRQMPGAQDLEDAWIRARLGEDGYLTGKDAEAAACDAQTVPVVTGTMDDTVIDQMINLARTAAEASAPGPGSAADDQAPSDADVAGLPANGTKQGRVRSAALSPEAWRAMRYAMARLAVELVSGPAGVAAVLRQGLLDKPYNTPSLPLDVGYSHTIPWQIRRAVLLRDKKCAWPRCGRPAVYCDVHHLRHKEDGGETSLENCICVCQFHHDVCIHRRGWQLILHPDGTTEARSPDGKQILYSHAPPTEHAALPASRRGKPQTSVQNVRSLGRWAQSYGLRNVIAVAVLLCPKYGPVRRRRPLRRILAHRQSGASWIRAWLASAPVRPVVALVVDVSAIKRRLAARAGDYGEASEELAAIIGWHTGFEESYRRFGAVIVDAARPLHEGTDEVLAAARLPSGEVQQCPGQIVMPSPRSPSYLPRRLCQALWLLPPYPAISMRGSPSRIRPGRRSPARGLSCRKSK